MTYKLSLTLEEKTSSLFQLDPVLPAQYLAVFRRNTQLEPEQKLMLAVLEDAVTCIQKYGLSSQTKEKRLFSNTRDWILTQDNEWPFSFVNVCEALGLDSGYVRRGIANMKEWKSHRPDKPKPPKSRRMKRRDRERPVRAAA